MVINRAKLYITALALALTSCGDYESFTEQDTFIEDIQEEEVCENYHETRCEEDNKIFWYDSCGNRDLFFRECDEEETCWEGRCGPKIIYEDPLPDNSGLRKKKIDIIPPDVAFYMNNPFFLKPSIKEYCEVKEKFYNFCGGYSSYSDAEVCVENANLRHWATLAARDCLDLKIDLTKFENSCERIIHIEFPITQMPDGSMMGGHYEFCDYQSNYCYSGEDYTYPGCFGFRIDTPCDPMHFEELENEYENKCK